MRPLTVPSQALPYILLQRLEVQGLGSKVHYSRAGKLAYQLYERSPALQKLYRVYSTQIEPRLRATTIASAYSATMAEEFRSIQPYLPRHLKRILGIGAGVAGLEAHLSNHLAERDGQRPYIMLLDKSELSEVYYDFHEQAAAYNSLEVARDLLLTNGHPADMVSLLDAASHPDFDLSDIDLVTSLIAWGFHFPVSTYLDAVHACLSENGVLILDVRKGTGGRALLESKFHSVEVIHDDPKFERVLARKRSSS